MAKCFEDTLFSIYTYCWQFENCLFVSIFNIVLYVFYFSIKYLFYVIYSI